VTRSFVSVHQGTVFLHEHLGNGFRVHRAFIRDGRHIVVSPEDGRTLLDVTLDEANLISSFAYLPIRNPI
jgi:hypothetical protein